MQRTTAATRALAIVLLLLATAALLASLDLFVPYQYEPLGPKAFPALISGVLMLSALALAVRAPPAETTVGIEQVMLALVLIVYALLYELLGMPLATLFAVFAIALLLQQPWIRALVCALAVSVLSWLVLVPGLDLPLPVGEWWIR